MATSSSPAIFYFHSRQLPPYLLAGLENARVFNPDARIFLVVDEVRKDLSHLGVEVCLMSDLETEMLREFRRRYVHIASVSIEYLRPVFERFFFYRELMRREGISQGLCLDSDYMVFHDIGALAQYAPPGADLSVISSPWVFIQGSLDTFLDYVLERYLDQEMLDAYRKRCEAAMAAGAMDNLDEMQFLAWALDVPAPRGTIVNQFPTDLPEGHVDHCIFGTGSEAMPLQTVPTRRHGPRKRVFWYAQDDVVRPYFRAQSDGHLVPAIGIHFQNGAKRKMHRFNRLDGSGRWNRALRLRYYNFLMS